MKVPQQLQLTLMPKGLTFGAYKASSRCGSDANGRATLETEVSAIAVEFAAQRPVYEAFTTNAFELLRRIIEGAGIEVASIECRTKSAESLKGKLEREGKAGKYKALSDITDISGLRIITYLKEDCANIASLLGEAFILDKSNSLDKSGEMDADRFGYQSIHLILSYGTDRLKLPEFKRYKGLKFEVQIKTLLQHTWSAIDWKLRYKRPSEAPRSLRRRLFRISALLDAADDELSYVYEQVSNIKSYYINAISRGDLALDIDLDSVDALLTNRSSPGEYIALAIENLVPVPNTKQSDQNISTSSEKALMAIKYIGISNIGQLDDRLRSFKKEKLTLFQDAVTAWLQEAKSSSWSTNRFDIARIAILITSTKDDAAVLLNEAPFNPILTKKLREQLGISDVVLDESDEVG